MTSDALRYEALVETLGPGLLRYFASRVAPDDAADLLADTFLVAWRRIADVPADEDEARMWLYGVAGRVLSQDRRSGRRRLALLDRLTSHLRDDVTTHDDVELALALDSLDRVDQEIIRLVHWDGFTLAEVARLLGRPEGTIRSRYHRARVSLRSKLRTGLSPEATDRQSTQSCDR